MGSSLFISFSTYFRILDICSINCDLDTLAYNNGDIYQINTDKSLNSTVDHYIKNGPSGDFWLHNRAQKLKLGKLLGQLCPSLTPLEIEDAVNKWKAAYSADTSRVIVSDDIQSVYDISSCGGSCMAHFGHRMEIYENLGCKIAYILGDDGLLKARAILWPDNVVNTLTNEKISFMDRIFYEREVYKITLQKWEEENGYLDVKIANELPLETLQTTGSVPEVPYVDTMYYVLEVCGDSYKLANYNGVEETNLSMVDILQSTKGNSDDNCGISERSCGENEVWCSDIEDYRDEDDCYWVEDLEVYHYYDDDIVFCENGYYSQYNDTICYVEDADEYRFKDSCYFTEDTETWWATNDELYWVEDLGVYYSDADNVVWCDDISIDVSKETTVYYIKDLDCYYYHDDGIYYDASSDTYWSSEDAYYEHNED